MCVDVLPQPLTPVLVAGQKKRPISLLHPIFLSLLDISARVAEKYVASKFRITKNQEATDYLIYDADDVAINNWLKHHKTRAQLIPFSIERELKFGAYLKDKNIIKLVSKRFDFVFCGRN